MNINKCKSCILYNQSFNTCCLYFDEIYLGDGMFDIRPVNIKKISELECKYTKKAGV